MHTENLPLAASLAYFDIKKVRKLHVHLRA